jgi:DNA-binding CsgD family transcriptional regulator
MVRHLPEWEDEDRAKIAFDKIWDDLAELPLVEEKEVNRVVDGGHFVWSTIGQPWKLSETQEEILREMARGMRPFEIAQKRNINVRSVSTHLKRIRIRLRVKTNEEAIAVAIGSGIVPAIVRDPELGDRINVRGLTERHKTVLKLMAEGEQNDEIAEVLGLSIETVKDHVKEICNLMGARNRTHAVSLAFTTGRLVLSSSNHK